MSSSSRKNEEEQATRMPSQRAAILAHGIRKIRRATRKIIRSMLTRLALSAIDHAIRSKLIAIKHNEDHGLMFNRNRGPVLSVTNLKVVANCHEVANCH
jgi:hypothetical protein